MLTDGNQNLERVNAEAMWPVGFHVSGPNRAGQKGGGQFFDGPSVAGRAGWFSFEKERGRGADTLRYSPAYADRDAIDEEVGGGFAAPTESHVESSLRGIKTNTHKYRQCAKRNGTVPPFSNVSPTFLQRFSYVFHPSCLCTKFTLVFFYLS